MESEEWKMESYDYQHLMRFRAVRFTIHYLIKQSNQNFPLYIFHSPLSTLSLLQHCSIRTGGTDFEDFGGDLLKHCYMTTITPTALCVDYSKNFFRRSIASMQSARSPKAVRRT